MILVSYEFTSDATRALGKSMRANILKFVARNIFELRFDDKCLFSNEKIPFNNSFALNDQTILHPTKTKIRDRCDRTNKINT